MSGTIVNNITRTSGTIAPTAGGLNWDSAVVTGSTASVDSGNGYWINTTSNACTVTLPASPELGDKISLVDYARTWATNNLIIDSNGNNFQGEPDSYTVDYSTAGQSITIVYSDATKGWIPVSDAAVTDAPVPPPIVVDFLVIAGGGGGGRDGSGGGGAGGYRASFNSETSGGGGSSESAITLTAGQAYTAVVGAGGAGNTGGNGVNSSLAGSGITTITSIGGGAAGTGVSGVANGNSGGSGGGAKGSGNGGAGTSNQGYAGNGNNGSYIAGGGGGAGSAGGASIIQQGGIGVASTISGSSVTRGGGGVAWFDDTSGKPALAGGAGNGAYTNNAGGAATANTGAGGAGGGAQTAVLAGLVGATGVVILRLPTSQYTGTTSGSPTVSASGSDTIITFNANGTYTA